MRVRTSMRSGFPEAGIPGEHELIQRMLSTEREARPQTMQEIALPGAPVHPSRAWPVAFAGLQGGQGSGGGCVRSITAKGSWMSRPASYFLTDCARPPPDRQQARVALGRRLTQLRPPSE